VGFGDDFIQAQDVPGLNAEMPPLLPSIHKNTAGCVKRRISPKKKPPEGGCLAMLARSGLAANDLLQFA
jgi:hypothetical protein